ncbi:MAG: hypothetical protein M1836_007973 [Candelina mexicana]|nr:MAG: hypothetical protein M1836_007973 [Candelina mexicana]
MHRPKKITTGPSQEHFQYRLGPKVAKEAPSRKRKWAIRKGCDNRDQDEPKIKFHGHQDKGENDSLKKENTILRSKNEALRRENKSLKRKPLKKHGCPICERSYNRSDGLYKHLWEGDDEHKAFAQKRYGTRCEICGRDDFKSWVGLQRHMSWKHGRGALGSADEVEGSESDESRSADAVRSTEDLNTLFPPLTPPVVAIRTNRNIVSWESPGFSANPIYPLNAADPGQLFRSHYGEIIQEAPSFSVNPLYPLVNRASGETIPSLNDAIAQEAPGITMNPEYALKYVAPSQTIPPFNNVGGEEAPILSNQAFNYGQFSLYNNVGWEAPAFSNRLAYPPISSPHR